MKREKGKDKDSKYYEAERNVTNRKMRVQIKKLRCK